MTSVIQKLPGGQRGVSISEFNAILDDQILKFSKASRSRSRLLSMGGFFTRFLLKNIVRVLRATLVSDFLGSLKEKGETQITVATLENFARGKIVGIVVDSLRARFEVIRYAVCGWLALFLGAPMVVIFSKALL